MVSALTWAMRIPSRVRAMVSSALTALRSRSAYFLSSKRRGDGVGQAVYGPRPGHHLPLRDRNAVRYGAVLALWLPPWSSKILCEAVRLEGYFLRPHQTSYVPGNAPAPDDRLRILQGSHRAPPAPTAISPPAGRKPAARPCRYPGGSPDTGALSFSLLRMVS